MGTATITENSGDGLYKIKLSDETAGILAEIADKQAVVTDIEDNLMPAAIAEYEEARLNYEKAKAELDALILQLNILQSKINWADIEQRINANVLAVQKAIEDLIVARRAQKDEEEETGDDQKKTEPKKEDDPITIDPGEYDTAYPDPTEPDPDPELMDPEPTEPDPDPVTPNPDPTEPEPDPEPIDESVEDPLTGTAQITGTVTG